jgi:hypothetical protein
MNETLYILMRDDMQSLNPGKAMAQACHAANAFMHSVNGGFVSSGFSLDTDTVSSARTWSRQTSQGFGTTITLAGKIADIEHTVLNMNSYYQVGAVPAFGELILDPTYPLLDGETLHLIPVVTCAYVFVSDRTHQLVKNILSKYNLHP